MIYTKVESNKIKRSNLMKYLLISLSIFTIVYCLVNLITSPETTNIKVIFRVYAVLAYFPVLIPPIVLTSLLFGREFQDRVMLYTFIRPVKIKDIFVSKLIAIVMCSIQIAFICFCEIAILGSVFFKVGAFEFDANMLHSVSRCILFFLYTCVGIILVTSFSIIINLKMRTMFGSSILAMILWAISSIMIFKYNFSGRVIRIPINTYLNPGLYYDDSYSKFIVKIMLTGGINIVLSVICLIIAYRKFVSIRRNKI